MIEDKELQSLVAFTGTGKVLSLYLDTNLAHQSKDAIKLTFRQLIKDLPEEPSATDVAAVENYLEFEYDWHDRGLALFSAGNELWKTIPLPIAVTTQVFWMEKPYVAVLSDVLDRFGQYGVALIGRESIRLFSVAWGKIQSATEAFGEELKHHKQGGRSAARYQRHEQNLAVQNLKQAVDIAQEFFHQASDKRLILAGSSDVLKQVRELMPKEMQGQIIGEFVADMEATPNEILIRSLDVVAAYDQESEKKLVSDVVTAASKGGAGVIGLADSLYLLHQGRVRQLLVEEKLHAPGFSCAGCGYVSAQETAKCPFCGGEVRTPVPDAVNAAIQQAVRSGAAVNVVRQNEELSGVGGMAATLRY